MDLQDFSLVIAQHCCKLKVPSCNYTPQIIFSKGQTSSKFSLSSLWLHSAKRTPSLSFRWYGGVRIPPAPNSSHRYKVEASLLHCHRLFQIKGNLADETDNRSTLYTGSSVAALWSYEHRAAGGVRRSVCFMRQSSGGQHQTQKMHYLQTREILQRWMPEKSLAKTQKHARKEQRKRDDNLFKQPDESHRANVLFAAFTWSKEIE